MKIYQNGNEKKILKKILNKILKDFERSDPQNNTTMIKKEYQKPTMNVVRIKTQPHLLIISNVQSNEGLKRGTSGDMDDAYSRGSNGWDEDEEDW